MALDAWVLDNVGRLTTEEAAKVKQFSLDAFAVAPLDEFSDIREGFARLGVWAMQYALPTLRAIREGKSFSILVGMRPHVNFHIGHLTLVREVAWLTQRSGHAVFVFASHEAGQFISSQEARNQMVRFGKIYSRFTGVPFPDTAVSFADGDCMDLQALADRAAGHLTVRKVLQLYGWDEGISLNTIRIPAMTAAAFLFPELRFPNQPTIVLSDIHQLTHAEATKVVARQLRLPLPGFSYRVLLPSLEGPEQRMSAKNPRSVIFLNDPIREIEAKLERSLSGGRLTPEEQRRRGGEPHRCSFFKVAAVLQSSEDTAGMYSDCTSGASLCGQCKQKHIPGLVAVIRRMSE